jgi:hypothetical protein
MHDVPAMPGATADTGPWDSWYSEVLRTLSNGMTQQVAHRILPFVDPGSGKLEVDRTHVSQLCFTAPHLRQAGVARAIDSLVEHGFLVRVWRTISMHPYVGGTFRLVIPSLEV